MTILPPSTEPPRRSKEKFYTLSEISRRTGISMPTLQRYKKTYQDRIPSAGAGRKQRYPEHALPVFAELRSENAGKRGRPRKNAAASAAAPRATAKRRPGGPGRSPGAPAERAGGDRGGRSVRPGTGRVGRPPGSGRAKRSAAGRRGRTQSLVTLTEISKMTGISYSTLVRYARLYSNRLPHEGKGRARRFHREAVDVFRSLRQESGRGGRRPQGGRRAAPGAARRGRPPKSALGAAAGRAEAVLARRVLDLERFRRDVEKRFGELAKSLKGPRLLSGPLNQPGGQEMEEQILRLEERIREIPEWERGKRSLDSALLRLHLQAAKDVTSFFGHESNRTERATEALWHSLELQTNLLFRQLDSAGLSPIIGQLAPDYLGEFTFTEASVFREFEEKLVEELGVPENGWDIFWNTVDRNKHLLFAQMRLAVPFQFSALVPVVRQLCERTPVLFEPLSPFKWSKGVLVGLATTLGIIDFTTAVPSGGISVASAVAAGSCMFYAEGKY